jgi:signal transduction histidine kinase
MGDPQQLGRALDNILENALKFTPQGGTITLSLERTRDHALLTVTDTGVGIPADDLPRLFRRFHRGRNSAGYPGNGLGLAITRAVVDLHGGQVRAASEEGQGTRLEIELPLADRDQPQGLEAAG